MHPDSSPTPLLSMVIPHFNVPEKLACMLDSILQQSFKNLEVIVVDDCSPDSASAVVEAFAGKGLPVRIIECPHRVYTMQARLLGMADARGEILYFVDADDRLWGTQALEKHVSQFCEHHADVLHFAAALTDCQGVFKEYAPLTLPFAPELRDHDTFDQFTKANFFGASCLWNKLFSRGIAARIYDLAKNSKVVRHVEDSFLVAHILLHSKKYIGSEHIGYGYWYENKMEQHAYERALYSYYLLDEIPPYLQAQNCPTASIERYKKNVHTYLAECAGRMCINMVKNKGEIIPDEDIQNLMRLAPAETIVKMLLLANQSNANKIVNTVHALFPQS